MMLHGVLAVRRSRMCPSWFNLRAGPLFLPFPKRLCGNIVLNVYCSGFSLSGGECRKVHSAAVPELSTLSGDLCQ